MFIQPMSTDYHSAFSTLNVLCLFNLWMGNITLSYTNSCLKVINVELVSLWIPKYGEEYFRSVLLMFWVNILFIYALLHSAWNRKYLLEILWWFPELNNEEKGICSVNFQEYEQSFQINIKKFNLTFICDTSYTLCK